MGLRIRTNVSSLYARRHLASSTDETQRSLTKLASGSRINRASDDAAGLAVSENLKGDLRSLEMAKRNAQDGVSMVQTAEGGLVETSNMLIRLRELAVQAASDTIGATEREFLQKEFTLLKDEVDRIAISTEFNGTRLLIGSGEDLDPSLTNGSNKFPLEVQVSNNYYNELDGIEKRNPINIIKIDFSGLNARTTGEGGLGLGEASEGTSVTTKEKAQNTIATIDEAVTKVNGYRASLGGIQNRLFSGISNLGIQIENIAESRSRIRDTDYAAETANLTKANILQQAGTAVLTTANAQPQVALGLLQGI